MSTPLSSMEHPQATATEQSRMELQAKLNGLGGINGRKLDPEAKAKKLREACEGFESIFIQKMWQEMRNTVPKTNLLSGKEEKFWQDMYDQELSKSMTKAGGIGLADMMFEQLSRNLVDASRGACGTAMSAPFTPSAAPLVTAQVAEVYDKPQQTQTPVTASIYEEEAPQPYVNNLEEKPEKKAAPEKRHGVVHSDTHTRQPGSAGSTMSGINGIDLAYKAKREAGDKLSASAVRPSMQSPRKQNTQTVVEPQITEPVAHGTAQSLQAALELAKTGAASQPQAQNISLTEMVAQAKARNASASNTVISSAGASQNTVIMPQSTETASAEPVLRKTRYSTNIPANAKNKKSGDVIRMLNVDNVSVNSKQGKGLAAYHAAQEQANAMAPDVQPSAGIKPLKQEETESANFVVPPLRPGDLSTQS